MISVSVERPYDDTRWEEMAVFGHLPYGIGTSRGFLRALSQYGNKNSHP
jgi:hypothetical protein